MTFSIHEGSTGEKHEQMLRQKILMEQRRRELTYHLTTLDATVLGIVTVFHDRVPSTQPLRFLMVVGVSLLFLSLLSGVYYIRRTLKEDETVYRLLCERFGEEIPAGDSDRSLPLAARIPGALCPIGFCLGLLSLLVCIFLQSCA